MVDFGTPLAGGMQVTPAGTAPSTREVAGYTILEADDMDAALALAQVHPHPITPGGCTIEVHEAQPILGMQAVPKVRLSAGRDTHRPRAEWR